MALNTEQVDAARAMRSEGASWRAIGEYFGVGIDQLHKVLEPEKYARRRAAKNAWQNAQKAPAVRERRRLAARDVPTIPGLLPVFDTRGVVDFARVDLDVWQQYRGTRPHFSARGYVALGDSYLHRLVLGLDSGSELQADHINRDKLDNRRCNLRAVTARENQWNRGGVYERCWARQQEAA